MNIDDPSIRWEPASDFIYRQTVQIEREFHRSNPRPRNRRMGFRGEMAPMGKKVAQDRSAGYRLILSI